MGWEIASKIEHQIARIVTQQEINGWKFDLPKARKHIDYLENERQRLYDSIRGDLGYDLTKGTTPVSKPFRKDGTLSERVRKYGFSEEEVGGPFSQVWYSEPDLGSRQKLQVHLERLGWAPIYFTEKGNPKIEEESLSKLEGSLGKDIARWYVLRHRQSQIQGWVDNVREDGRISAGANPCGTPTGRMRHTLVVNVPKANHSKESGSLLYYPEGRIIYGTEMRELFIAEDGYVLVGYDAKGLELRILAHYMNDPEFTEVVVYGDPHGYNQQKAGLHERDHAKTLI